MPDGAARQHEQTAGLNLAREAALRLFSLIRTLRTYPPTHPRIKAASEACVEALEKVFAERPGLLLLAQFDKLLCEDGVLSERDPISKALVEELRKRQIRMLLISRETRPGGILNLAKIIAMKPEEVESRGGPQQMLVEAGVGSIEILEFRYSMDGEEVGAEIEDPQQAVEHVRGLLAYQKAYNQLVGRAELSPEDASVMRKALAGQSVLEKSMLLDDCVRRSHRESGEMTASLAIGEGLVGMLKVSRVRAHNVGVQAIAKTVNWVLDTATQTVRVGDSEEGDPAILAEIAEGMLSSPEKLGGFVTARVGSSGDSDPEVADLLKYIFSHAPSAEPEEVAEEEELELRAAPKARRLHTALKRLEELGEAEAGRIGGKDVARSAADVLWQLMQEETSADACRKLGTRLVEAMERMEPTEQGLVIGRLLQAAGASGDESSVTALRAACQEVLDGLDTTEMVRSILASDCAGEEKEALLESLSSATPRAVPAIVERYFESDEESERLLSAIGGACADAVAAFREKIEREDPASLRGLWRFLRALKDRSAVGLLEELSYHANASVSRAALAALGENATATAAAALSRRYKSSGRQMRKAIILLLGRVPQPASVETLTRIAQMRDLLNRRVEERLLAVEALGRLRRREAEPFLRKMARLRGFLRRQSAARLREAAALALERLGATEQGRRGQVS